MRLTKYISLIIMLFSSCIDPLDIRIPIYTEQLVIEGGVYSGAGPHRVNMYQSLDLNLAAGERNREQISQAEVKIIVDDNQEVILQEVSAGVYETTLGELIGEPGKTYQLHIRTADQEIYESSPQQMEQAGEITKLYFEFVRDVIYDPQTRVYQNGFVIYLDANADESSTGLLRWRYTGTFEIISQPELKTAVIASPTGDPLIVPNPPPCSGFVMDEGVLAKIDECSCCNCWVSETDGKVKLANTTYTSNKKYERVIIAIIPIDRWRFYKKYSIEVEQLSLTEDTYEFWKAIEAQQKGSGSLFQPNIAKIKGNIQNLTNPSNEVLGIFNVSATTKKSIFINRMDIPYCAELRDPILDCLQALEFFDDCRLKFDNSSNSKPLFW